MDEYEVVAVDHETFAHGGARIYRLGVRHNGGAVFTQEEQQVVRAVGEGKRYFVQGGGEKAYLTVAVSQRGIAFVQTIGDRTKLDNLESLPPYEGDRKAPGGSKFTGPKDSQNDDGFDPAGVDNTDKTGHEGNNDPE